MSSQVQSYPPIQSPLIDPGTGMITNIWSKWMSGLYIQTGTSNSTSLTSLIATVATIQSQISTINGTLTGLQNQINSFGVGRQL